MCVTTEIRRKCCFKHQFYITRNTLNRFALPISRNRVPYFKLTLKERSMPCDLDAATRNGSCAPIRRIGR